MEQRPPEFEPFRILIVEDEFLIALDLRFSLEDLGYDVIGPAATVAAALAVLDHDLPDACILDVNLRGEYSTPVAEALKAKDVPFLLISAYEQTTLDQYSAYAGVTNIGKPIFQARLISTLESLLRI